MNGIIHELQKYHTYYDPKNFTLELFKEAVKKYYMEKKYFTPNVDDLRVGYVCQTKAYPYLDWVDCTLDNGDDIQFVLDKEWDIRVPFITKEDFISRGWTYDDVYYRNKFRKFGISLDGIERIFELSYNFDNHMLKIDYDGGEFYNFSIFEGECKDVNTFDYIVKLLKIS